MQYDPLLLLMQQTWQGTSFDSAWEMRVSERHQFQSNLPVTILGIYQPTLHLSLPSSGITSVFPTPPSFPGKAIPIKQGSQTLNSSSYTGTSLYRSPSNLPPHQDQPESRHWSLSTDLQKGYKPGSSLQEGMEDQTVGSKQQHSERLIKDSLTLDSIPEGKPFTTWAAMPVLRYPPLLQIPTLQIPNTPLADHPDNHATDPVPPRDSYILKEEARHFTCQAYNMIHPDHPIEVPAQYQRPQVDLPPMGYTPEPMADKPPVPLQQAIISTYTYAPSKPQLPTRLPAPPVAPGRWVLPRYPSPPKPPDPLAPWVLATDDQGPWAVLKPNIVKEPENFNGNSNDIAQFFSQFIFCTSRFGKDAQVWWELCARELGRNNLGDQVYSAYEQFMEEWERLRQSNFSNGDLFFQQFESLAFKAGVLGIDQMMVAQIKKVCQSSSKDTIYASDEDIPATYMEWKRHILQIDYNWRMWKVEAGGGAKVANWKQQAKTNTLVNGNHQQQASALEKKTATGTTYGGQGVPMEINRACTKAKCF
ncbi:hypothetical protein ARMGADRAFT_1090035 [Armillaria gallica]|uniref:Uncharacterized protein n=1 Tax=Armillaria gallica TaxID=47427 RepID=A0A2H3CU59_ARMGA|nr:hypothetical protein ARMGADRAFT_1090035 [Armillaria gallica]